MLEVIKKKLEKFNLNFNEKEENYLKRLISNSNLPNIYKRDLFKLLIELRKLTPRMWENEEKVFNLVEDFLNGFDIMTQKFKVTYPLFNYSLYVEGKEFFALPNGIKSGKIKRNFVNSLKEERIKTESFFNYNPLSKEVSTPQFYESPTLAINTRTKELLEDNKDYEAEIKVKFNSYNSGNIIVGNLENPKQIILTHFDSFWGGVIDNAFSVVLLLILIKNKRINLNEDLVVFTGGEELSIIEEKVDWALGYKVFYKDFGDLLEEAKRITIVDTIGIEKRYFEICKDPKILNEAFPFEEIGNKELLSKSLGLFSNYNKVMEFYHSPVDNFYLLRDLDFYFNTIEKIIKSF